MTANGITTPFVDELYEAARKSGAVGGKLLGAGGGGYLLLYVPFSCRHKVTKTLNEVGGQVLEFRFEPNGVQTWRVYE
jgi:D-glycero-alpha-D-manno-heptose-7-phosphate kinase